MTSFVPYQDATSTVPSCASRVERAAQGVRARRGVDDQRHQPRPAFGLERRQQVLRGDRHHAEVVRGGPPPVGGLDRDNARARSLQHQGREGADRPEPEDHDPLARNGSGVQRDLQRRLDEREQRRLPGRDRAHRHQVAPPGPRRNPDGAGRRRRPRPRSIHTGSPPRRRHSCSRTGRGTANVPPSAPIVSSTGSAGSSSPRYASISVPPLIPENDVCTLTSPSLDRAPAVPSSTSTDRGPSNQRMHRTTDPVCPRRPAGSPCRVTMTAEAVRVPLPTPYRRVRCSRLRTPVWSCLRGHGARGDRRRRGRARPPAL